jgi:hypothetical protein
MGQNAKLQIEKKEVRMNRERDVSVATRLGFVYVWVTSPSRQMCAVAQVSRLGLTRAEGQPLLGLSRGNAANRPIRTAITKHLSLCPVGCHPCAKRG